MNDKIKQLRREIELEQGKISKCKHSFTEDGAGSERNN